MSDNHRCLNVRTHSFPTRRSSDLGNDSRGGNGSAVASFLSGPATPLKDLFLKLFDDGDDVRLGEDGNDLMFGGPGTDELFGGPGNDILGTLSIISGDSPQGDSGSDLLLVPWAGSVDGGSSLTIPDTEIDICVFPQPFLPWIPPLALNNCRSEENTSEHQSLL